MNQAPHISVIISTYNRAHLLPVALKSLLAQNAKDARYEIIAVDNNSTDDTRRVVESFIKEAEGGNLRYVFEGKQGLSHGRNAGIETARAPLVAFTDDDVCPRADWVARIVKAFDKYTEAQFVGGKVLPCWEREPPAWLTRAHWSPLALVDYGDAPRRINAENPLAVIGANFAFRRQAFVKVGMFAPDLQRVGDGIGSMEDHEMLARLWRAGEHGMYVPDLVISTDVQAERMTKDYHRRWHTGHGHFYAMMRDAAFETSAAGKFFDVPAHLYRQAVGDCLAHYKNRMRGDEARAFEAETRLCFFKGYYKRRQEDYRRAAHTTNVWREVASFACSLATRRAANIPVNTPPEKMH